MCFLEDDATTKVGKERDRIKSFDQLQIDWAVVGKQLQYCSRLFQRGKKL
ncbi:uncharacterized protein E0L32_006281 [Thyridium curvatum]|uniref:Uncharacterized protein n=1 Tax=Thyridium curvatum TaxID=1093900 RepID=A0A507B948_9PEZI|nr:uncharacterized protein E0L32_006281 [Thyridium curvatum]TPX13308.1 hypothetical protein E0L32_006281 [Thyridium curvatum]